MEEKKRVNCKQCKYYYITWDSKNANGCKYFGFKTNFMPSMIVRRNSGKDCEAFIQK